MVFIEARECSVTEEEGTPHRVADLSMGCAQSSLPVKGR